MVQLGVVIGTNPNVLYALWIIKKNVVRASSERIVFVNFNGSHIVHCEVILSKSTTTFENIGQFWSKIDGI